MTAIRLIFFCFFSQILYAQEIIPNEYILHLDANLTARSIQRLSNHESVIDLKALIAEDDIYHVVFDEELSASEVNKVLSTISPQAIYPNYRIEQRNTPNDPRWSDQWNMEVIGSEDVWGITTGGITPGGKEIVVAVIDDGYDLAHDELNDNLYFNEQEIPNNNIDDDGNGYIDDVQGWNFSSASNNHPELSHGTAVSSIIGAKGNNNIGLAGVNHDVKILPLSGVQTIAEVVESLNYCYETRKRYNDTDGSEGAFIVATNFSAGISGEFGSDWPIWCNVYDKLGSEGVLSISAAENRDVDADAEGDLPTTCDSEFLITVTNTSRSDEKIQAAGFGSVSVDLGAPGDDVVTATIENGYRNFPGSSASAPHVTGAVALMYALPCDGLSTSIETAPESAARNIKRAIMESVTALPSLNGITVSGGRLQMFDAVKNLQALCGGTSGDLAINHILARGNYITFEYETPDFNDYNILITDVMGRLVFEKTITPPIFGVKELTLGQNFSSPFEYPINITNGIYILYLYNENESVARKFMAYREL
jgi:hypothetical protein